MKSLFLLSLPRSLSCLGYHLARQALGLAEPTWTSDGEILNLDRMAAARGFEQGAKFTTREHDPVLFQKLTDFLHHVAIGDGFAFKDVVQPFVISAWPGLGLFRVLKIRRPVADVAYAMLAMGWHYPGAAARGDHTAALARGDFELAVLEGLIRADAALGLVPGATLEFDDFITDEGALAAALSALYPSTALTHIRYMDANFLCQRREQLLRRKTTQFQELQATVCRLRETLQQQDSKDGAPDSSADGACQAQQALQPVSVAIRQLIRRHVPREGTVLVISKGNEELLNLDGRRAWHFPRGPDGEHAPLSPAADSAAIITHLEDLRVQGADHLLIPRPAFWWLEHYCEFCGHLETNYGSLAVNSTGKLYRL